MDRPQRQWLRRQLPALVSSGVLDSAAAERLEAWCSQQDAVGYTQRLLTIFASIGVALLGLGTLLLLAFNWDWLARGLRLALALLPLLASQAVGAWVLLKRQASAAWREGASLGLVLGIGTALALISQIYQLPGDLDRFLLVWAALSLPVVYLFGAISGSALYLAAITVWALIRQLDGGEAVFYWLLFLAILPRIALALRRDRSALGSVALLWLAIADLSICLGMTLEKVLPGLWVMIYAAFFGALWLAGNLWYPADSSLTHNPLRSAGYAGTWILACLLTYSWPWEHIGWQFLRSEERFVAAVAPVDLAVLGAVLLAWLGLFVWAALKRRAAALPVAGLPLIAVVAYLLLGRWPGRDAVEVGIHLAMNGFILAGGLLAIVNGARRQEVASINAGVLLLTVLICLRFIFVEGFFEHLLVRGGIFVGLGAAFLAANVWLGKQYRKGRMP